MTKCVDSGQERSPAVFVIGALILVALWLPPMPWTWGSEDLPAWLSQLLIALHVIREGETWRFRWDYVLIPPAFLYAIWRMIQSRLSLEESGLTWKHFGPAVRFLAFPSLLGCAVLIGWGMSTHQVEFTGHFLKRLIPLNAFAQQMGIQWFFHRELMSWFGRGRRTVWILTAYFVALHAPNPGLMLGTLVGMYVWASCYQRHPNLYALAISHSLLSAVLMQTMPRGLLPSVSVGWRFVEKGIAHQWWGWGH